MEKRKVICRNNLPSNLPVTRSVVVYLALEHWNAPEWLYGVTGMLLVLIWGVAIYNIVTDKKIDIFEMNKK